MCAAKQVWGTGGARIEEDTWSFTNWYQAPHMSTFWMKAGNKDYTLSGITEAGATASNDEKGIPLKVSELGLKRKYS